MVPLISSFMLSTKEGKKAWVEPIIDAAAPERYRFEMRKGTLTKSEEERLKKGTKTGRGTHFSCLLTGAAITPDYVRDEGLKHRLSACLIAIVCAGKKGAAGHFGEGSEKGEGRVYVSPATNQEVIARSAKTVDTSGLEVEMPDNPRWFSPPGYGLKRYVDLFTPRQLVALTTFSDLVTEARDKMLADARVANVDPDSTPLHDGGAGATAYADAVATYLAFALSKTIDYGSSISSWHSSKEIIRNTFARQAIPMTWDYVEPNVFSASSRWRFALN
jgi:putative DNA methylase